MPRQIFPCCLLLTFYLTLLHESLQAQEYSVWEQFSPPVKYENIRACQLFFQDSKRFLWGIDKDRNLIKFDGLGIIKFQSDIYDPTSYSGCELATNNAEFLEDRQGNIWIKSGHTCLDRYDPVKEKFERIGGRLQAIIGEEWLGAFGDIYEDGDGHVWIGTTGRLFRYTLTTGEIHQYKTPGQGWVSLIFEDVGQNLWVNIGSVNSSIYKFNKGNGQFTDSIPLRLGQNKRIARRDMAAGIEDTQKFLLLIGFNALIFDAVSREVNYLPEILPEGDQYSILYSRKGLILLGTFRERLYRFDPQTFSFEINPFLPKIIEEGNSSLANIFQSEDGIIWFTKSDGIYQLLPKSIQLESVQLPSGIPGMTSDIPGTDAIFLHNGTGYFNTQPVPIPIRKPKRPASPPETNVAGLKDMQEAFCQFDRDEQGSLWMVASWKQPKDSLIIIRQFDKNGKKKKEFSCRTSDANCFPAKDKLCYLEIDKEGILWMSTRTSLSRFDPNSQKFQPIFSTTQPDAPVKGLITCLLIDSQNDVWVGSTTGLAWMDRPSGKWVKHVFGASKTTEIKLQVLTIFEDSRGTFWVGTDMGLIRLDKQGKSQKIYGLSDLLPGLFVKKIFEDHHQNLWATTDGYLARYQLESDNFIAFMAGGDISRRNYLYNSVYQDEDNFIYLPDNNFSNSISFFHPDSFHINPTVPQIYFTDFQLANQSLKPGDFTHILQKSLDFTEKITLKYAQNDFTIHYTAPEYIHPNETVFAVQLEGFNDEWQEVGTKREARYTNLNPGTYTFKVKVRNHHGFWSETPRTLKITVLPPWYRTWWAYTLWAALIFGSIYWFYRFQLRRQLEQAEAQRLQELDFAKSRLYTNITHEFRTPLTIILGMVEQMKSDPKNWFNEGLQLIRRNGKQLLNLVNQLLDLSKLESGHMPLNLVNGDIVAFLQYLTESFHSFADSKDIRVHFWSGCKELHMDYDPEKLQNVVSNLLSNAIKFTPAGGDVYFQIEMKTGMRDEGREMKGGAASSLIPHPSSLLITVRDNGHGIAPQHLPHIFDRFYQVDSTDTRRGEGTGIGLAMTKELVKLMGGEIKVESEPDKGTTFTVLLPVTHDAAPLTRPPDPLKVEPHWQNPADISEIIISEPPGSGSPFRGSGGESADQPLVLLIEDNADVITYLTSFLSGDYRITTATNGKQGIEKAIELTPDLVVSDVMMPEKDGFEVCATLKTDERTSHIPIILLTAKSDPAAKLEGLTHGADAYLAKPFNKEELLVRMEKLIDLRQRLQTHYQKTSELMKIAEKPRPTPEDIFLQKLIHIVEENLADEHFGLPDLCRKAALSRSQLFRKLKALTGKSTTHFIRSIRLAKGRAMLETTDMTVSEVAYAVGFGSATYFAKMFGEEFGVAPSGVRKP